MPATMRLLENLTADGSTSNSWVSGRTNAVCVEGTFGGGTITIEASPDEGTTWVAVDTTAVFTADAWHLLNLPLGVPLRATLAGATGPDINVHVG